MESRDKIATYYVNARELVKQNNPKAARAYVLAILNCAVETYNQASAILLKAKTQIFLDKWIKVSRELFDKGITEFVLTAFGLNTKSNAKDEKIIDKSKKEQEKGIAPVPAGEIDISGLIDESAATQGWCAEIFDKNKKAVVEIIINNSATESVGTGFIISKNGYILTNDHVVFNSDSQAYHQKVKMSFVGDKKRYKLKVLFSDKKADVALCQFQPDEIGQFSVVKTIDNYSQVLQGADCLVIGNAFGMGLAPFTGVVRFTKNNNGNLVYTAPSNPGDSGGPVLNRQGECIGMNKSKTLAVHNVSAEGYANATPWDKIKELLDKWCGSNDIIL